VGALAVAVTAAALATPTCTYSLALRFLFPSQKSQRRFFLLGKNPDVGLSTSAFLLNPWADFFQLFGRAKPHADLPI
jgi:hypothetical protein